MLTKICCKNIFTIFSQQIIHGKLLILIWTHHLNYYFSLVLASVRTSFGLDPKTRMDPGPTSPHRPNKPPFFEFLFMLYNMVFASFSSSTCESGVGSFPVPSRTSLNLLLLAVRLLVYCSGITSTLMRPESRLGSI